MPKTTITKRCYKCKTFKPLSAYNKNRTRKDGHQKHCRACMAIYAQSENAIKARKRYDKSDRGKEAHRAAQLRFLARNPDYSKANNAIRHAIIQGIISSPDSLLCSCEQIARQYHHHRGYTKKYWLDVVPVCIDCHRIIHKAPYRS